jgi:3-hydroxybutyryl-CoA dehydratase
MAARRELLWGWFYEDVEPGCRIELGMTVGEAQLASAVAAFGDPGPNHVDEEHAAAGRFGARVVHGPVSLGVMTSVLGQYFGQSIVALRDLSGQFRSPVYVGDTLRCEWRVVSKKPREKLAGGGLLGMEGAAMVRRDGKLVVCVECEATLAVGARAVLEPMLLERRS